MAFLPMWFDYARVLANVRGTQASLLYSFGDLPILAIPLLASLGRRSSDGPLASLYRSFQAMIGRRRIGTSWNE